MNTQHFCKPLPMILLALSLAATGAHGAQTTRASVSSSGKEANRGSDYPSISADGRFVAFHSWASFLVPGDTNEMYDIFVRDRLTSKTSRISVSSAGAQGNNFSAIPTISADGRFVVFYSRASNLVFGDNNSHLDTFVHDRLSGKTARVSVDSTGAEGNNDSYFGSISADGRYVVFVSSATNLVEGDTNSADDVFIRDLITNATTRVSVDSSGLQGSASGIGLSSISADGRFVTFSSNSLLVADDTNGYEDVFIRDLKSGTTTRVSVSAGGAEGNGASYVDSISADGRFVAFMSEASNLVSGDNNGATDVFIRDLLAGTTERISINSSEVEGNDDSGSPSLSADGRFVAFHSHASNLVVGDSNATSDIFIRDRLAGKTFRASVNSAGKQGNSWSVYPSLSADARRVAFKSYADNLVSQDTNWYEDIFVRDRLLKLSANADIKLTVSSQPASVQKGQTANYVLTIKNNGLDNAGNVTLIDILSKGRIVSLIPTQGNCSPAVISICHLGALQAGASVTIHAAIKAGSNPLTQKLTASAAPLDNQPANNIAVISTPVTN